MTVAETDYFRLGSPLRRVHLAYNVSARRSDALVAREIEVHQRFLNVLSLVARIVAGLKQLHGWLQQYASNQVVAAHLCQHLLSVSLRLYAVFIGNTADVVGQQMRSKHPQAVDTNFAEYVFHREHTYAILPQHTDIPSVLLGCFLNIEVILKQTSRRVNHSAEKFLARSVHQNVRSPRPLGSRIACRRAVLRRCHHSQQHSESNSQSLHLALILYYDCSGRSPYLLKSKPTRNPS